MAKLKIDDGTGGPVVQGYLNVVNELVMKPVAYQEFLDADPDERADLLQTAAKVGGQTVPVTQLPPSGSIPQEISSSNCRIVSEKDRRIRPGRKSRVTVPIANDAALDYLDKHCIVIATRYAGVPEAQLAGTPAAKLEARKFLFGLMMLTRCR